MNKLTDFVFEHSAGKWHDYVTEVVGFLRSALFTYTDFAVILDKVIGHPNSKITGLKFTIKSNDQDSVIYEYEQVPLGQAADNLNTQYLDGHNWFRYEYSIWYRKNIEKDGTDKDEVTRLVRLLIEAFWKSSSRDENTRIWTKLVPGTGQLINSTLSFYKTKCHYITILYCDLDQFHELNRTHGDAAGDLVLLQMAALFTGFVIDKPAILLHDKGDEFIILIFTMYIEEGLAFAYDFQKTLKSSSFEIPTDQGNKKLESEITVGINIRYTQTNDDLSFSSEIKLAEQAAKDEHGNKRYRIANLHNAAHRTLDIQLLNEFTANASKLNLKVSPANRIFRNVWLNLITEEVVRLLSAEQPLSSISEILDWIQPGYTENCAAFHEYTDVPDYAKDFSAFDVLIAVNRGIIMQNAAGRDEHFYEIRNTVTALALFSDKDEVLSLASASAIELKIGTFFQNEIVPVAILVRIGHNELNAPERIFGDIITVDDRPSMGGGLPDFWELALAKVVNQVNADPNIKFVYIIGERQYGSNTVEWLERIAAGKLDQQGVETITYKIRTTHSAIDNTRTRLKEAVKLYDSIEQIAKAYSALVTDGKDIVTQQLTPADDKPPAFLQKDVRIKDYSLTAEDGFKVKTLAEAYPLMLEVARLSTASNSIRDQARGFLGELIDFKVELSNPTRDLIPFYYRADKEKFETYFDKLFLQEDGLFAVHLNKQLDAVIKHIEESIHKQYSTRRAILIIPSQIKPDDLKPLGLVSVRIIPRVRNAKSVGLVFSYTWRTVEALVGFPYSLYGSVKYGEHILALLQQRVNAKGINITFDKVSYIASSLHIFMDEQGQAIAKSIINDASI